ncbi:ABC transporter permease [Anaerocolumna jejuensis]|uniref:ABC transporter permease n=1 Tax=Anaerocolumna jejuensis TaxID=259063 RepID=UPI003F7CCFF5
MAAKIKNLNENNKSKRKINKLKRYYMLYLMMVPGLIYLLINNYVPMTGLYLAFKNIDFRKGLMGSDWIAFKNFEFLFKSEDAFIITRNTILYNLAFIAVNTVIAVMLSIFLNEIISIRRIKLYQSLILLPYLISMVVVSYLVLAFLSTKGFINDAVVTGLFGKESGISWYSEAKYWPFIIIFVNAWKNVGYLCIIYYASIIGISNDFYEAAALDGARMWQKVKYITIPLIKPTVITMVLLSLGRMFYSDFGLFYQVPMDSGALYSTTNVIDTYVYRALIQLSDIGMSSAAGVYQSIVGFVVVLCSNLIVRKVSKDNALF